MATEIGSEFWRVPVREQKNELFPESTHWYISGRSALQAIIKELENRSSVSLPSWCCDSMIKPFVDAGYSVHFYPVYWQDGLVQEINYNSDVLLLMDYFGYTGITPELRNYSGVVIRDVTHSLFSSTYGDACYYFGSIRKWCGIWTGGFAWAQDEHSLEVGHDDGWEYIRLRQKAMQHKAEYIEGKTIDKGYLKVFNEAEDILKNVGIVPAAERDIYMAERIDSTEIKSRRRRNAEVLRSAFSDWLMIPELSLTDSPMFVPVLVPGGKRDLLRRYLINKEIYCPVHWPVSEYHKLDERTSYIYKHELSLVCDQRYTEDDMHRIVEAINAFWKEA